METRRKLVFDSNHRNWSVGFWWNKFRADFTDKPLREFYFDVGPFQIGYVYDIPDSEMTPWDEDIPLERENIETW